MKRECDAEFFAYRCPYTDKPCYDWDCDDCEVEAEERAWMKEVEDDKGRNTTSI